MINRIKGTQDFLDLSLYNFFIDQIKKHLAMYAFQEIATPLIEPTELFTRSLGQETDVVSKEMFYVTTAHAENHHEMCLRPEMTASMVRAFTAHQHELTLPWKAFSHGPVFRHERPQKGRFRQFHQVSIEIIGTNSIAHDAQTLVMLDRFFHETLKLENYALLINFLGCAQDRILFKQTLAQFLTDHDSALCATCKTRKDTNILRIFDCKNPSCQELYASAPKIAEHLCPECQEEWQTVQTYLHQLSVSFSYSPHLVRGLDYYDKTVFEFVSMADLGAQNTFCGGGRYEKLASVIGGGKDQPSIGAGIGIERILMMLESAKDKLALQQPPALAIVMPLEKQQHALALQITDHLQAAGICSDTFLEVASLKSMLRKANKLGARYCLIVGPDELTSGTIVVKNMLTGSEETVPQRSLVTTLKK